MIKTMQQQESFAIEGPQLEVLGQVESRLPAPMRRSGTAAGTAVVLALVAVLGIGGFKLKGQYDGVRRLYTAATEHGNTIGNDLASAADYAANVIRMSGNVLGEENANVISAQNVLADWNTTDKDHPTREYDIYTALASAVEAVYQEALPQAGSQEQNLTGQYQQYASLRDIIRREAADYNTAVQQYNAQAGDFPAGVIGALWQIGEIEEFA